MKKFISIFLLIFSVIPLFADKYMDFIDALYYEKSGDYKKSFEIASKIAERDNDPYLYKYLYEIASKGNLSSKAMELSKKLVEIDSMSSVNWISYGNSLVASGDLEGAKKAYKKAIEVNPDDIDAYYQLALISSDNVDEAVGYFNKIIEIDPSFKSDIYYNIAVLYSMKKNEIKMIDYLNKAINEDPYSLKPYYFLAMYWDEKGDFLKSLEAYKNILRVEPTNTEATNRIAELYISTKDYGMAEKYFLATLERNPANSKALWWMSLLSENKKDFSKAKKYLSQIKGWENDIDTVLKMSYFNIMDGDIKNAISILESAHKKWPDNLDITYYLGLGFMDIGDDRQAKTFFEEYISTRPDSYEARFNLGVVCERLNNVECFEKHFGYLLLKNPQDSTVLNYLGYSLIDRGIKIDEAIYMIEKALQIEPENPAYLDSLGWGYYKKGDYSKALELINKSIEIINKTNKAQDPLIYEHKADILVKIGDFVQAYDEYRNALISGAKNFEILNKKSKEIISQIPSANLLSSFFMNNIEDRNIFEFEMEFGYSYRKFLKKKNIRFSFNGIMDIYPARKYFGASILSPLFTPVLNIEIMDGKYNIKNDFSFEENNYNNKIDEYILIVSQVLNWYFNSSFYLNYKNKTKLIKREGLCHIYNGIIEQNDSVKLCSVNNMFVADYLGYKSDMINFSISFNDYRIISNPISDFKSYYVPYNIIIEIGKSKLDIKTNKIEIKYGKP